MKYLLLPRLTPLSIFFFLFISNLYADNNWHHVKDGNKIILIRHSLAPGNGDPLGFNIKDCRTQRNLNQEGINQSIKIGKLFKKKNIPIDKVFSSEWCRCKDTAKYAFEEFEEFSALNSTFQKPFDKNELKQIKEIKAYVKKWNKRQKNLVFITHYSIITALTKSAPSSGEIVITDKNFNVLGTIPTN
jgi:phosphohistidine phosphatase SixA